MSYFSVLFVPKRFAGRCSQFRCVFLCFPAMIVMHFWVEKWRRNDADSTSNHYCATTVNPWTCRVLRGKIAIFQVLRFSTVRETTLVLAEKTCQKTDTNQVKNHIKLSRNNIPKVDKIYTKSALKTFENVLKMQIEIVLYFSMTFSTKMLLKRVPQSALGQLLGGSWRLLGGSWAPLG